jgi:hypothetical protein
MASPRDVRGRLFRTAEVSETASGRDELLRLANALSALRSMDSEDKRLLDAMLLAVPR